MLHIEGLPCWLSGKEPACQCRRCRFNPWVRKIPWRRKWQPLQCSCLESTMDGGAWWANGNHSSILAWRVPWTEEPGGLMATTPEFLPGEAHGRRSLVGYSLSLQFSSVAQSCPTLLDPMNRSTPGLPVHHQLPEFTQTLVHRVGDAIQPSHPLSSPSPPAPNPSQHQAVFQ